MDPGSVILVDDREIIARLVPDAFMTAGHALGGLLDGFSALERIKRRPPDFLVPDCNMPGLSGVQLLHIVRESSQLQSLPVLLLTGRESDERIVRYEGANAYLRKPFDAVRLVGNAEAMMSGGKAWT
ncbi:response regulator [Sphingomonas glacialis]|uniref:Response regulator n=1 Tax=Sphingomonas glacialis TaxID=658225 RepID=A0A502FAZ4_9SPHN|nr:response regulator [Sphingomonas glacialis]